jgi:molybdopterin/thiamine biosynthesis adenylyltransferase
MDSLTDAQIERYSREIILEEIGSAGIDRLQKARVTIIGGGGLGCPAIQILAGAGVGAIRIIDGDRVELSNLPRQFLHTTADIGEFKVESIRTKIQGLNPDVHIEMMPKHLTKENAVELLGGSDYVIEATDNIFTKFLVNDVCVHLGIPVTIAGVVRYGGHILSVDPPHQTACYRCLFQSPAVDPENASCAQAGVLASATAIAGSIEAHEAIAGLLQLPERLLNKILTFDLKAYAFTSVPFLRDPKCPACNPDPNSPQPFFQSQTYREEPDVCQTNLK